MNKVILIGHLGKDAEVVTVGTDCKIAKLSLATTEGRKNRDGQWENVTEWHSVMVFSPSDFVQKFRKGMLVCVEGKLRTRSWQDKQTTKTMYATEIVSQSIRSLERPDKGSSRVDDPDDLPFD